MEKTQPSSTSGTSSRWLQRFYATFPTLHEQQAEIHRLYEETVDQQRRLDDLEKQQTQRPSLHLASNDERLLEVDQLQRELQEQDVQMLEAAQTIEVLIRDVQVAREVAKRAEKAQREAEADQMLRHVLHESDSEGSDSVAGASVRLEAEHLTENEQPIECRANGVVHEEVALLDDGQRRRYTFQASEETEQQVVSQGKRENEMAQELEEIKTRAATEVRQYQAMNAVRQELVAVLQTQVETHRSDKESMDRAIVLCQRSADKRFQVLERDRQKLEAENLRLCAELTNVVQYVHSMDDKLRELEEEDGRQSAMEQERLNARLARACAHQDELTRRVADAEQKVALIISTTKRIGGKDSGERESQGMGEKEALFMQLEEERQQSKDLKRSTSLLQESMESALKELRDVEIELRAINSNFSCDDDQHDTLAGLAKQVISDMKRFVQKDAVCVQAIMASIQVQHLTSSMHAHLRRLRTLRNQQEIYSTSTRLRDYSNESADDIQDATLNNFEAAADNEVACRGTI